MTKKILLLAAAPLALAGCAMGMADTAPLAAGQAAPITAAERQQGAQANAGLIAEFGGAYSGPQATYVERIGRRAAVQSGLSSDANAFDVTLLNSPVNNAFAVPGGYIYATRQLVALMNDEAELAAVLGHEVAHVAARHSQQRQSVTQRNTLLGALGQAIVGAVGGDSGLAGLLGRGIGTGAQLATLGYSRGQETQSDDLGIQYLVRAGYDPAALSTMLESLAAQNNLDQRLAGNARTLPGWASTHPDPASRIQRAANQAAATGATGTRNRDAFLTAIDGMMYGDDPAQGVIDGRDFLYPTGRVAFTVPQGYTMQNGARAVTISGQGAQARFATASYSGNIDTYVRSVFSGLTSGGAAPQIEVQRTTINGIPTATATVRASSGQTPIDATVVAYAVSGTQAYHFVIVTAAGQGAGALAPMAQSFRRMTASEASAIRPRYVRVVTVGSGDTVRSLAQRMAYPDNQLERFLVLNRLSANADLRAGERVKIVAY
jgi:predicted Zn-dependent protease